MSANHVVIDGIEYQLMTPLPTNMPEEKKIPPRRLFEAQARLLDSINLLKEEIKIFDKADPLKCYLQEERIVKILNLSEETFRHLNHGIFQIYGGEL